ncbi:MAG: group 1 truncated hemoglobin [Stappiaceae bacterium]
MQSIFERSGGFAAISKVVINFYNRVLDSDTVGPYFENINLATLIDHQTKFIAQVMGGPVAYSDEQLKRIHEKHAINQNAFEEVAELMKQSLQEFNFPQDDINHVLGELGRRAPSIVNA